MYVHVICVWNLFPSFLPVSFTGGMYVHTLDLSHLLNTYRKITKKIQYRAESNLLTFEQFVERMTITGDGGAV